jgi:hypothetical protein
MANLFDGNDLKIVQELKQELRNLKEELSSIAAQVKKTQTAFNSQSKTQDELGDKTKKLTTIQKELDKIQKRGEKVTYETVKATEQLRQKRKQLVDQVRKDNGTLKKSNGLFKSMTKAVVAGNVATLVLTKAFRAITGAIKDAVKTNTLFSKGMSEVKAITGATSSDFKELYSNAITLGQTTAKSAVEISKLQKEFAKLGFSTKEILNATEATINLSIAAGSDLASSAVVAASTIRGFGLDAKESTKVVDIMAKSFTSSALDLEKFKVGMSTAAPVAKTFGKDLEFTTAQLAVLSDTGIDASTAGTSLRNMFLELNKKGLTWEEGLAKINESTNKNVTALDLFGKRGATAALILAENTEKANRLESQFRNSAGAAKKMADVMQDNLAGDTVKANSAIEGLYINIGKRLDPALRRVVQGFTRFVSNINKSISPLEKQVNLYTLQDKELTILFHSLKNTNLSQEARNKLIETANEKYGKYLPNLLTEKSTLEDIEKAETAINKQLKLKIIQQAFQEQINELLQAELKAKENIIENEILADKLAQERITITDEQGAAAVKNQELFLSISNSLANSTIENNATEVKSTEEKFKRIGELYGIAFAEIEAILKEEVKIEEETTDTIITNRDRHLLDFTDIKQKEIEVVKGGLDQKKELEKAHTEWLGREEKKRSKQEADEKAKRLLEAEKVETAKQDLKTEIEAAAIQISVDQYNASIDEKLNSFLVENQAEQDILKNRLDKGLISESQYEKEIKKLKLKAKQEEAKAEKKKAIFDIAINTIVGSVKALPNLVLSGIVAGIGIAQGAVVAARPIPKFGYGSNGPLDKDTRAKLGDRYQHEAVIMPDGNVMFSQNRPHEVLLPAGSEVLSGEQTKEFIQDRGLDSALMKQMIMSQKETTKAVKKLSTRTRTDKGIIDEGENYRNSYIK